MKIFISWSENRSRLLAEALRNWLPLVLHYVEPWLSQADIEPGQRWADQIAKELEASNFGIICVTRENVNAPWMLFEAGALAKSLKGSRVIPLLLDLEFRDVTGPLALFQAKKAGRAGILDMVHSLNQNASSPVQEDRVSQLFNALWNDLERLITAIPSVSNASKTSRSEGQILEELVSSIRNLDAKFREMADDFQTKALIEIGSLVRKELERPRKPLTVESIDSYPSATASNDEFLPVVVDKLEAATENLDDISGMLSPNCQLEQLQRLYGEALKSLGAIYKIRGTYGRIPDMKNRIDAVHSDLLRILSRLDKINVKSESENEDSKPKDQRP